MHTTDPPRTVDDLMTNDLVTIDADATIDGARELMSALGIHALPVESGGAVVGIVTSSDLAEDWQGSLAVAAAMRSPVRRVRPQDTIEHAVEIMLDERIHHLVVDGGNRLGIISSFDLLEALRPRTSD